MMDHASSSTDRRSAGSDNALEIIPPLGAGGAGDEAAWTCTPADIALPPELEFDAVKRIGGRNAVTPMKQRVFIRVLAETGRVSLAAKAAGNVPGSFYYLRNQAKGKSFGEAWDRARDFGTGRVLDTLLDHAVNGTPEYIYKNGELVAERRRFNHQMMMWLVSHNMPERFGASAGGFAHFNGNSGPMKKLRAKWEAEWRAQYEAELTAGALAKAEDEAAEREAARSELLPAALVRLYQAKVRQERLYRLSGQTLFADHALRSLVHLELYMEFSGLVAPEIMAFFDGAEEAPHPWETETSRAIEAHRLAAWAMDEGEGVLRPGLLRHGVGDGGFRCGPTYGERSRARTQAERQMAEAQALWEACATEEGWSAKAA